jgi:hypothetical protein
MNISYGDAGFTKATLGVRQTIKRFLFHGYLAFFLRFSGFFLLGLIAYLHFFFDGINPNHSTIGLWMVSHSGYLIVLEVLRLRKFRSYDANWFALVRIISNIILLSWLLYAAPLMRSLLFFAYLIPFIAAIVYFPQHRKFLLLVYAGTIAGIILSSVVLAPETPLTIWQTAAMAVILGITLITLKWIYEKLLRVPESLSNILGRLKGTLDLLDVIDQIGKGVLTITGADGLFILIVDPEFRSYVTHKIIGLDLSPTFEMDELISQCDAIQHGRRYEREDLENSGDKQFFQQFFTPPPRTILVEPLIGEKQSVLGLVMVGNHTPIRFAELRKQFFREFVQACLVASPRRNNCWRWKKNLRS